MLSFKHNIWVRMSIYYAKVMIIECIVLSLNIFNRSIGISHCLIIISYKVISGRLYQSFLSHGIITLLAVI